MTESLNFKRSTARVFAQQHIYTNLYLFMFFFFILRQAFTGSTSNPLRVVFIFCSCSFADIQFAVMGASCCYHIPILNAKWRQVCWIIIRHQQLRCYYLYILCSLDMDLHRDTHAVLVKVFKKSHLYLSFKTTCSLRPAFHTLSFISHRRPRVMASVKILWQIVLS